jgi:hypothetical protein
MGSGQDEVTFEARAVFDEAKVLEPEIGITFACFSVCCCLYAREVLLAGIYGVEFVRCREPSLAIRRLLYHKHGLRTLEANNLFLLAKLHRREKNMSVAADALIQAEALGSLYCRLEEAKLLYDNKEVRRCWVTVLRQAFLRHCGRGCL